MTTDTSRRPARRAGLRILLASVAALLMGAVPATASAAVPAAHPAATAPSTFSAPGAAGTPTPANAAAPATGSATGTAAQTGAAPVNRPATGTAPAVDAVPLDRPAVGTAPAAVPGEQSGLPVRALSSLPPEAAQTYRLIESGGPFPYDRDGIVFQNREGILPAKGSGYYHEYTVPTPGSDDRGTRRIVTGSSDEVYYTGDHYASFVVVDVAR